VGLFSRVWGEFGARPNGLRSDSVLVQSTRGGPNPAVFVNDPEVEESAIGQVKRQLGAPPVGPNNIEMIESGDAAFDFEVRRNGLAVTIGEVLIDRQVIVDRPSVSIAFEYTPFRRRLLDESLHGLVRNRLFTSL
jgi:hypothetical protein